MYTKLEKKLADFTPELLYQVLKLRVDVFVVEQNCPYQELDGLDPDCVHFFYQDEESGQIAAYLRVIPKNDRAHLVPHIGRVCVHPEHRGKNLARALMKDALNFIEQTLKETQVQLSAQAYLVGFYESFGFKAFTEPYLLDDIPHVDMVKSQKIT